MEEQLVSKAFDISPNTVYGVLVVMLGIGIYFLARFAYKQNDMILKIVENNTKALTDNTRALSDLEKKLEENKVDTVNAFKGIIDDRIIQTLREFNLIKNRNNE